MKMSARMRTMLRTFDLRAYLKEYDSEGKDNGHDVAVLCPVCEKPEKLWVLCSERDNKTPGAWICYYCDEGGQDVLSLIRRIEDCSLFEALEILTAYQTGEGRELDLRRLCQDKLFGVQEIEAKWDETPMEPVPLPKEFKRAADRTDLPRYFKERGITKRRADKHNLGYCNTGYFTNRLVVPVTMHEQHLFFVARWMAAKPPRDVKKTLYPKGAKPNRVLFNYDTAKKYSRVYLVEDVFSAMHIGNKAMATFGTQFSQYQMELLLKTEAEELVIIWDRDLKAKPGQGGYEKAQKLAVRLAEFWTVRVVKLPDERDPDELSKGELIDLVEATPKLDETSAWRAQARARLQRC